MFGRFTLELEALRELELELGGIVPLSVCKSELPLVALRELAACESTDGSVKLEIFDFAGRPRDAVLCEPDLDALCELAACESTDGSVKLEIFDCEGRPLDADLCEPGVDAADANSAAANVAALCELV